MPDRYYWIVNRKRKAGFALSPNPAWSIEILVGLLFTVASQDASAKRAGSQQTNQRKGRRGLR